MDTFIREAIKKNKRSLPDINKRVFGSIGPTINFLAITVAWPNILRHYLRRNVHPHKVYKHARVFEQGDLWALTANPCTTKGQTTNYFPILGLERENLKGSSYIPKVMQRLISIVGLCLNLA